MKNQAQRKATVSDAPVAARPRLRVARGEEPPRAERISAPSRPARAPRVERGGVERPERRDPLAYRAKAADAPGPRPERPAPAGQARPRVRNRRRIPPVVLWNRRLRSTARFLVFALIVEAMVLCLTSPLLRVENVTVTGATVHTPAQIRRLAGLEKSRNIFRTPVGKAENALAALPEIQSVKVERKLPRTIAVSIQERGTLASVQAAGKWWAMDAGGRLFRTMAAPVPGRPALYANVSSKPVLGTRLQVPAVDAALKCLAMLPGLPLGKSISFHVDARNEAWLNNANGLKIRLGPLDDAPARLAVTERLLKGPNGPEILKKALVLDMATPDNEVYKRRENTDAYRLTGGTN